MTETGINESGSADLAWVWEIHKNCDQLLHQRLAAFTAAQAMTLAAFTLLTVARFNANPEMAARFGLLEAARLLVAAFGLIIAVFGWLVTYAMYVRIQYLNEKYLKSNQIYSGYLDAIEGDIRLPIFRIDFPLPFYRNVIPKWLPLAEFVFWAILLLLTVVGIYKSA